MKRISEHFFQARVLGCFLKQSYRLHNWGAEWLSGKAAALQPGRL